MHALAFSLKVLPCQDKAISNIYLKATWESSLGQLDKTSSVSYSMSDRGLLHCTTLRNMWSSVILNASEFALSHFQGILTAVVLKLSSCTLYMEN